MKEKPILFNGEMVRAILDGRKTQTRRPFKPQPGPRWNAGDCYILQGNPKTYWCGDTRHRHSYKSPFGKPGDGLWVRERLYFDADAGWKYCADEALVTADYGKKTQSCPSIHMPRAVSRINREILRVWVERVQDITWQDAKAEGVKILETIGCPDLDPNWPDMFGEPRGPRPCVSYPDHCKCGAQEYLKAFQKLWDSIYTGELSWDSNPWTWACEFKEN